jgi:type I restriction enzyme, S subunit
MFNWQTVKVKDCIKKVIYTSKIPKSNYKPNGKYPIVSQDNELICGYWDNPQDVFITGEPIIVFGDHTQVLKFIDFDFVLGADGVKLLRPKKFLDPKFFYYALKGVNLKKLGYARHFRLLKEVEVNYPESLSEQKRLVVLLYELFEKLEKAKKNAERNLNNAKELFESYLQGIFDNSKNNWEIKKWGELCHFVRGPFGGSLKKSIFKDKGFAVYEQKHAIHDHFEQLRYFIDKEKFNEMSRFEVKPGDIIMSCSGVTLGKVAIVPENIPRGIINQALLKLTPNKDISVNFLKYWLRSKIFQDIIFKFSGGAAIPNVPSAKILKEIEIPVPNLNVQIKIVEEIEELQKNVKKLETIYRKKIDDLDELKQSILDQAFTGKL